MKKVTVLGLLGFWCSLLSLMTCITITFMEVTSVAGLEHGLTILGFSTVGLTYFIVLITNNYSLK